jgi:ferredoxin
MAPALNPEQALYVSEALPQTRRIMVKDEDVCLHCGLCAERCPTAAWDMRRFDLLIPYAGTEGATGSVPGAGAVPLMPSASLAPST